MLFRKLRWHKWLCLALTLVLSCTALGMTADAKKPTLPPDVGVATLSLTDLQLPVTAQCLAAVVHYGAYSSSMSVGLLENGRKVEVVGSTRDYYRVNCYGSYGYLSKALVTQDGNGDYYVNLTEGQRDVLSLDTYAASFLEGVQTEIVELAHQQIGSRYRMGGTRPGVFDCSGLVYYIFGMTTQLPVARTATPQCGQGLVVQREDVLPGDLVFFYGTDGSGTFVTHVGICIGDGQFIHASSSRGVVIADLDNSYWSRLTRGFRRLLVPASTLRTMDLALEME